MERDDVYFIVTNQTETYKGQQLVDGLNELFVPFDDGTDVPYPTGAFEIYSRLTVWQSYGQGINIRTVILPRDDTDLKIISPVENDKLRTNKIILGKKYSLAEVETYEKLRIPLMTMDTASGHGFLKILDKWLVGEYFYSVNAIDWACQNGHVEVLNWWKKSKLEPLYTPECLKMALENGHVNVLKWFLQSDWPLSFDDKVIQLAKIHDQTEILELLLKSRLSISESPQEL